MASSPGWHEAPLFTQRAGKKPERTTSERDASVHTEQVDQSEGQEGTA